MSELANYVFLSVLMVGSSCSMVTAATVAPVQDQKKICTIPGEAKERALLRIGTFGKVSSLPESTLSYAEHFGIRYTSNLIVADLAWECPVETLNTLMKRHDACIVSAQSGSYVAFQIPNTATYDRYKSIEADFIRNDCVERISPTFDLRAWNFVERDAFDLRHIYIQANDSSKVSSAPPPRNTKNFTDAAIAGAKSSLNVLP